MNRRYSLPGFLLLCFAILMAIVLVVGCDTSVQNKVGTLTVSTADQAKTISPDSSLIEIVSYRVSGIYSDDTSITFEESSMSNVFTITDLLVGNWSITFEGLNGDSMVIASQTQMVTINEGYNTTVTFLLTSVSGDGICELTITWPVTVTSVNKITVGLVMGTDVIDVEVLASEASLSGVNMEIMKSIENIPAGSYAFKAKFWDDSDEQIGLTLMETVNIYAGMTSTGLFALPEFLFPVEAPMFDPEGGIILPTQTIALSTNTEGAMIYYTLDGTDPNTMSLIYTGPFSLSHNMTVKAIAVKECMFASDIASMAFEILAATPTIAPLSGTYMDPQEVTIETTTMGATIYYTIDGSLPTTESILYEGPFMIYEDTTIQAIATHSDFSASEVASAEYEIVNSVGLISIDPANYEVELIVPADWTGDPVITNVVTRIYAQVTPDPTDETYTWYLDGEEALNGGGSIASTTDYLDLGPDLDEVAIVAGPHILMVTVTSGEMSFSDYYWFCASDTGTIGATSFEVGEIGPSGGIVFYDDEEDGIDDLEGYRYLEAAPMELEACQWGAYGYSVVPSALGTAIGAGMMNTQNIVSYHDGLGAMYPLKGDYYTHATMYCLLNDGTVAAKLCDDLECGGYDDWFLPSKEELALMCTNLMRSCHCDWTEHLYWSSSEFTANCAWSLWNPWTFPKHKTLRVKAIRAF
jgi:hypothetical protein